MDKYLLVKFSCCGNYLWEAIPESWIDLRNDIFYRPKCANFSPDHVCRWYATKIEEHSGRRFAFDENLLEIRDLLNGMLCDPAGEYKVNSELLVCKAMDNQLAIENQLMRNELGWCKIFKCPRLRDMIPIKTLEDFKKLDNRLKKTYWANIAVENLMNILTVDKYHLKGSITKILFAVFSCELDFDNEKEQWKEEFTRSTLFEKLKQHIYALNPNFDTKKSITDVFTSSILVKNRSYFAL